MLTCMSTRICALGNAMREGGVMMRSQIRQRVSGLVLCIMLLWGGAGLRTAAEARDGTVPKGAPPQVPEECQQPNLSKETQRLCDQQQFADVPHYNVVRLA